MDVGVATDEEGTERRFTCMAGIGFDANVIREVTPRLKRYLKSLAFPLAALKVYFRNRRPTLHIVDRDTTYITQFAVVANGQHYGGEFEMAEDASLRSGKLQVVLIEMVNLLLRPDILARILAKSPPDRAMKSFPSQEILATSPGTHVPILIDGEVWGRLPMSIRIEPTAPRVIR
jgi:diacylglycerol kinase (ATP)